MQRGKKRANPSSSAGGGDLLDSILGGMTKTIKKLPAKPIIQRGAAGGQEELEVDSHFAMFRPPKEQNGVPIDRMACRNADCGGREFDTDWRQGDRICRRCGAVQNNRSCESQEEEHRTFAEDKEKGESKERTSVISGKGGGGVGQANLQRAQGLAMDQADSADGMTEADRKRLEKYRTKVTDLALTLELQGQIVRDAHVLCERLIAEQLIHDKECGRPGNCRLSFKGAKQAPLVAAAILKEAMRSHGTDRLFEELKQALVRDEVEAVEARKVGKYTQLVSDLLKGRPYSCTEVPTEEEGARAIDEGGASAAGSAAAPGGGPSFGGVPRGMSPVGGGGDGVGGVRPNQAAALLPRLCDDLHLPYFLQQRAIEIVEDWQRVGMPASIPQTIASVAVLRAHDELVTPAHMKQHGTHRLNNKLYVTR